MIVALVSLILDQANKLWLIFSYDIAEKAPVTLAPFFDLVMVWNRGISYGLLQQDSDFGRWALIVFALGVSIGLALWLFRLETRLAAISVGLIIGGAIGNAIDRIAYGAVADFYSMQIFGFDWYVFNLADCWVVAGVVGLLYDSLFAHHKKVSNRSKL
ncbi:signal peptidase II [Methyloligella halotolerans]|uniref:signal peptidase II n=1 Tax=Methyloligella halotolerans TaxID=1177755 RepID=UPI001FD94FBA|nr:signal peptidase II [Methyloligella halotolerans]